MAAEVFTVKVCIDRLAAPRRSIGLMVSAALRTTSVSDQTFDKEES